MYKYIIGVLIAIIIIIMVIWWPVWSVKICARCASTVESYGDPAVNPYKEEYGDHVFNPYKEEYGTNSCVGTFDCTNESFTAAGDIAANTMWQGYQYRTAIPG